MATYSGYIWTAVWRLQYETKAPVRGLLFWVGAEVLYYIFMWFDIINLVTRWKWWIYKCFVTGNLFIIYIYVFKYISLTKHVRVVSWIDYVSDECFKNIRRLMSSNYFSLHSHHLYFFILFGSLKYIPKTIYIYNFLHQFNLYQFNQMLLLPTPQ